MKRKLLTLFLAALVALTFVASCTKKSVKPVVDEGTNGGYTAVYLTVTKSFYKADEMTLAEYMAAAKTDGVFTYEAKSSDYGAYLVTVNGRTADDTKHEFWSIYTSNEDLYGGYGENYEYNGTTLYAAGLGMDSLPVKTGEIIMFILMSY